MIFISLFLLVISSFADSKHRFRLHSKALHKLHKVKPIIKEKEPAPPIPDSLQPNGTAGLLYERDVATALLGHHLSKGDVRSIFRLY